MDNNRLVDNNFSLNGWIKQDSAIGLKIKKKLLLFNVFNNKIVRKPYIVEKGRI